ncbi:MAG: sporulation protein YqfD [Clostridia bacterium]|nr:sporulation protein YqfD [Clostridia bacterium]
MSKSFKEKSENLLVDVVDARNSKRRTEKQPRVSKKRKHPNRFRVFASKFGKTVIKINSKNARRVLAEISKTAKVDMLENDEKAVVVAVKSKHLSEVIAILDNLCYDYKIIKIMGVVPTFFALAERLGIVVGLAVVVAISVVCTSFITRVSVDGVRDAALKLEISALLEESGARRGGKVSNVDEGSLEKALLSLNGVAFASVKKNGGHISVYVKEELPSAEFEEISGSQVVAKKRAVVTRVIVDGGTAVVKYGDVVGTGDLLIDGYTEYGDQRIAVQASGEVWGKVYYQKKLYFADTTLKKEYGRKKTVTKLSFFGIEPKTPKCDFENYELRVKISQNGFFVPYKTYVYEFFEITGVEETNSLTDEEMKLSAYSQVLEDIDTAVKVLDVYYEIENSANGKYLTVTVEAEERIS